ncbi:DnaA N-terminal domain-containing protein [Chlorobium sp. KB01]|uniref:DnaA N-terminal domain-containing protein n=1 Tax=Chlorobium sp. KB01 TaxID=1917528 RepID=UPI000977838B|nr:DnaA N-terminal domain-containing protein [Chlorobium sp. KB01]
MSITSKAFIKYPQTQKKQDTSKAQQVWDTCMVTIKEKTDPLEFKTWFSPIKPLSFSGHELTIEVPSQFFYDWIAKNYSSVLKAVINDVISPNSGLIYSISKDTSQEETVTTGISDEADTLIAIAQTSFVMAAGKAVEENDRLGITTHGSICGQLLVREHSKQ